MRILYKKQKNSLKTLAKILFLSDKYYKINSI